MNSNNHTRLVAIGFANSQLIVRNVLLTWQHAIRQELLSYITNFHTSLIPFCKFLVTGWLNLPLSVDSTMSNNRLKGIGNHEKPQYKHASSIPNNEQPLVGP